MARKRAGHVRILCPHCSKQVNVQRPQGFQRSIPCPNCRIPIPVSTITAAEDEAAEREGEAPSAGDEAAADALEESEATPSHDAP